MGTDEEPYAPSDPSRGLGKQAKEVFDNMANLLREPLTDGGRRLMMVNLELFAEHDRLQAEAELRDALLVPAPILAVAVFLNSSLSAGVVAVTSTVLVVLLILLFVQARSLDRDAFSAVLYVVADHTIALPVLDRVDWVKRSS
jgi:hypothetical protein